MKYALALLLLLSSSAFAVDYTCPLKPGDYCTISIQGGTAPVPPGVPPPTTPPPTTPPPTPVPPPGGGLPPNCKTMFMDWAAPQRLYTKDVGGFGPNDVISVQFQTGSAGTTTSLPRFAAAEYDGPPLTRYGVISDAPCSATLAAKNMSGGPSNSITIIFAIAPGTHPYYGSLQPNRAYYFNMRNDNPSGGNMFIDLVKPGGVRSVKGKK